MKPDPPIRKDQRCTVCKGIRGRIPKTITQRKKADLIIELAADPFCSTTCARRWHSTTLVVGQPEKAPPADMSWTHA
jgi:hypothetical protein